MRIACGYPSDENDEDKLGRILLEQGIITREQLKQALALKQTTKENLGRLLIDLGFVSEQDLLAAYVQLRQALALQQTTAEKLRQLLVDLGFASEQDALATYAQQLDVPIYDPAKIVPDPAVRKVIPDIFAQRYQLVPLRRNGNKLLVAMVDPTNIFALDDLRLTTGFEIEPILASVDDINEIRKEYAIQDIRPQLGEDEEA